MAAGTTTTIAAGPELGLPDVRWVSSFSELLGAYALVQDNYVRMEFKPPDSGLYHFSIFNLLPATKTLIAMLDGTITGTVTLVPDSALGLPFQSVFPELYAAWRTEGHRLGEATMFADRRLEAARAWPQLRAMLRLTIWEARRQALTRMVVLCHPRHAVFYLRRLPFQQVGDVRPCGHVSGAPAVPIALDLTDARLDERIDGSLGNKGEGIAWDAAGGEHYCLTDQRTAALVAVQPPVLTQAPGAHRRTIVELYPTLLDRLRRLHVGRALLSLES